MTTFVEFPRRQPADPKSAPRDGRIWRSPHHVWIRRPWVRLERDHHGSSDDVVDRRAA